MRAEVAHFYGDIGNEGVDPIILAKLMFLLFFDDVPSERELLASRPKRLDYLWFLGYPNGISSFSPVVASGARLERPSFPGYR